MAKRIVVLGILLILALSFTACADITDFQNQFDDLKDRIEQQEGKITGLEEEIEDLKKKIAELTEGIYEAETDGIIELHTWFLTSGVRNNAIKFNYADENVVFECFVDNGFLVKASGQGAKTAVTKSGDTIYWRGLEGSIDGIVAQAFVDIILKIDGNIVGYAIIEIFLVDSYNHKATILKSVLIPKIGGEYQKISDEQIKDILEKAKTDSNARVK